MRFAWVPLVVVLGLGMGAGDALSQAVPAPTEPDADASSTPKRVFQSLRTFGAFGASAGGHLFLADEDAADGALIRPSLQTVLRYRFSDNWVGIGDFGFGWSAFDGRGNAVLTVMSGTVGVYRRLAEIAGMDLKMGGGGGFYRWNYKLDGKSIRDPESQLHLRGIGPGLYAGVEVERRMTKHATVSLANQFHYLFTADEEKFPTMLGGNDAFVSLRFGVNYHFSPYQGLLWEKEQKRVIRLESGKAGS